MKPSFDHINKTLRKAVRRAIKGGCVLAVLIMLSAIGNPLAKAGEFQKGYAPAPQVEITIDGAQPITIRADEIEADRNKKLNHFIGRVSISRGNETITADRAVWNDETNTAELSGHIKIDAPDFIILAERAVVNIDLQMAKVYEGRAYFPARNYYVSGALIERLGEKIIHVEDGTATTCDGPNPAWTIHADSLTVTEGGYATASGMAFKAGDIPVFSMPYFVFPVKNERQSGFLVPFAATSSRDGFTASLPIFWATSENHDLTFTPVWRNKRGLSTTVEGRYHFEQGRGIWLASYLSDNDPQRFYYNNSPVAQKAKERYWLRAQNYWQVGEWDINLNLDLVSDPLYLAEFRNDLDGFHKSANLFNQEFGHTVNEYLDPNRSNTLFAQRAGYDTFVRGGLEYNENLYSKNNYDTIQKLPSIQFNMVSRPLTEDAGLDLGGLTNAPRLSLDMRYDYFYRLSSDESSTDETGHRMVMKPSLSWSNPIGEVANFQVDGDLELSMYNANGRRPSDNTPQGRRRARHESSDNRLSGSMEATLSTTLGRVYDSGLGQAVATRHQITPTVSFSYVGAPDDQSDLPYWDTLDRRLPRRTVRYGILNTLVSKTPVVDENGQTRHDYFQFLKVGLWSSYEFHDNSKWANRPEARYYTTNYYDEGAGPIEIEIEAFLNQYFSARLLTGLDGRTGKTTNHDLSLRLQDPRGDSLTVTYDYDSPSRALKSNNYEDYEEIRADLSLVITPEWIADFSTRYDIHDRKALETHARLVYQAQCYSLGLMFSDTHNDKRVGVVVDLLGLGSLNHERRNLASPPQMFYQ